MGWKMDNFLILPDLTKPMCTFPVCDELEYKYIGVAEECYMEKKNINMQNWYSIAIIN